MNDMNEILRFEGTAQEIADAICKRAGIQNDVRHQDLADFVREMLQAMDQYSDCLSDKERVNSSDSRGQGIQGFIPEDVRYYVSVKKASLLFFIALAKHMLSEHTASVAGSVIEEVSSELAGSQLFGSDIALFHRIDNSFGEGCILLEAALNKKKGINVRYFTQFKGQCVNNHIPCGFRRGDTCTCNLTETERICETLAKNGVLQKKGKNYFYADFI